MSMQSNRIGLIGFGEVGRVFAKQLRSTGVEVFYHDVAPKDSTAGVTPLPLHELVEQCESLLSVTSTQTALAVAASAAPFLTGKNVYVDMNSTSASVKQKIAGIVAKTGAQFVEAAILSAVGEAGAKAAILVCGGPSAQAFAPRMNQLGFVNLKYFSATIGDASQFKMLRSIFSKGVECLLLEMLVAARRAGIAETVWKEVVEFMTTHPFGSVAENWVRTHPMACARRYEEMRQVLETLDELNVPPTMSRGTTEFFKRSIDAGLQQHFPRKPEDFRQVAKQLDESTQGL